MNRTSGRDGAASQNAHNAGLGVVLVDPLPLYREGVSALLQRAPGMRLLGHASTHHAALQLCDRARPDIVVLDSTLDPRCHLAHLLTSNDPALVLVALVGEANRNTRYLANAISAGIHGAIPRSVDPLQLIEAIRRAHSDRRYLDPSLAALATRGRGHIPTQGGQAGKPQQPLSRREYQVLQLIADGLENQAIAKILYVSVETVRTHVKSILRKLGARDRTHAVATAFRTGVLVINQDAAVPAIPAGEPHVPRATRSS
ncbi:LuxR family two component transcriptional regulator [Tamaricihabitans halophyticus]|uniref:LuxR family two component transcriptional regulator n=1 Tax=Tamaricihabitans halophyticus TaxID=1262583 RepID=A0A4R2R3B6_9PSEU|nr:response regulator transcription factor [Tamaricihabitans halophyticus]TCP57300.1 LuxR family two component transcriptional regulator [Tamaricihabitans halophyticus]